MRAVLIGIGQYDDFVVFERGFFKDTVEAGAQCGDDGPELLVFDDLIEPPFFDVERFAAERKYRLETPVPALLGTAAGAVALNDEKLVFGPVAAGTAG